MEVDGAPDHFKTLYDARFIAYGLNDQITIMRINGGDTSDKITATDICQLKTNIFIQDLQVSSNIIVTADLLRNISVFEFRESDRKIEQISCGKYCIWVNSVVALS